MSRLEIIHLRTAGKSSETLARQIRQAIGSRGGESVDVGRELLLRRLQDLGGYIRTCLGYLQAKHGVFAPGYLL